MVETNAKEYAEQLSALVNQINNEFNSLSNLVSKTDIAVQDILHKMELNSFTKEQAYEFALQLKNIRQERRTYKTEIETFHMLVSVFDVNRVNKMLRKINSRYQQNEKFLAAPSSIENGTNSDQRSEIENSVDIKEYNLKGSQVTCTINEQEDVIVKIKI